MYRRFFLRSVRPLSRRAAVSRRDWRTRSSSNNAARALEQPGAGLGKWLLATPAAAALLGTVAYAFHQKRPNGELMLDHQHWEQSKLTHKWVNEIAEEPGTRLVLTAEALMKADHPFLEDDHMFSAFVGKGIVDDLHGFYNPEERTFKTIISLGREVCGFPRVVHGGLTAAIIDESFGGLLFALKQQKALNFWGPAYTVSLEVQYKSKIAAGSTVLCVTEVEKMEGRKLWMKATVCDGPGGKVFATARALFVAPRPEKMVKDVAQYLFQRVFPRE